jgi:hypothetical protein
VAQDDLHMNVPWQATAAFFGAFVGLPLVFIGCMFIFATHGYMAREFGLIALALALPFLIWCAFAVRSRVRKGKQVGEAPGAFAKSVSIGLGIMLAAIVFVLIVRAVVSAAGGGIYVIPGGLFLAGAIMFVRAMTPPKVE